jgi:hypothetical protein
MNLDKKLQLSPFPLYPLLFGIYPVLFLWNANRAQEPAYVVIPSLLVTLGALALIYLVTTLVIRNAQRAAIVILLVSMVFLSYGHLSNLVASGVPAKFRPSLLPAFLVIMLSLIALAIIHRAGSPRLTRVLNLVSAALVVFQVVSAAPYYLTMSAKANPLQAGEKPLTFMPMTGDGKERDVYFILIDNYGREDVLRKKDNFDNSQLVNELKKRGFIFPDCAQGNYFATAPVMTSMLNMNYLDQMGIEESVYAKRAGYTALAPLMQDSEVMRKFKAYGYHTVTFRGFMGLIDIQNSDTYINYESDKSYNRRLETKNFNALYFQTTMFNAINEQYKIYPDWVAEKGPEFLKQYLPKEQPLEDRFYQVYQQNLYAWDALTRIPKEINSPKFVYAHIYSNHWPFMMKSDGSLRLPFTQQMTVDGYVDAVKFTNSQVLGAIDSILKNSEIPPVIILQGDHSDGWVGKVEWSGTDRLKILSAYYLPAGGEKLLYDEISPINNFRLVFKYYFGEDIDLLPDNHLYLDPATKTVMPAENTCISHAETSSTTDQTGAK